LKNVGGQFLKKEAFTEKACGIMKGRVDIRKEKALVRRKHNNVLI